jgi:uncharacterized protein YacL (UPF0231 family)
MKKINNTRTFFLMYDRKKILSTLNAIIYSLITNDSSNLWVSGKKIIVVGNLKNSFLASIFGNINRTKITTKTIVTYRNYLLISRSMISINKWLKIHALINPDFLKELAHVKISINKKKHLRQEYLKRKKNNTFFISSSDEMLNEKNKISIKNSKYFKDDIYYYEP